MDELTSTLSLLVAVMIILALVSALPQITQTVQTTQVSPGGDTGDLRITLEGDSVIPALNAKGSYTVYLKYGFYGVPYEVVDVYVDGVKYAGIKTDGTGKAEFQLGGSTLGIGTHNLTVSYGNVSDSMTVTVEPYAYIKISFVAQTDPLYDPNYHITQVEVWVDDTRISIYQSVMSAYSVTRQVRVTVNENHTVKAVVKGYGNVSMRLTIELEGSYTMRTAHMTLDTSNNYTAEVLLGIRVSEDLSLSWWYP